MSGSGGQGIPFAGGLRLPALRLALLASLALLAVAAAPLLLANEAEATHFRGGTLYADAAGGLQVTFEGRLAFRMSYFGACAPGMVHDLGDLKTGEIVGTTFITVPLHVRVDTCNGAQDWFLGTVSDDLGNPGIPHVYSATSNNGQPWVASWLRGDRLSYNGPNYHVNNPDRMWQLQTTVDLLGQPDQPPHPFVPPVVGCPLSSICTIAVPYVDQDLGETHALRWSTGPEATGGTFVQPGPCPPLSGSPGCASAQPALLGNSDPSGLFLTWNTTGAESGPANACDRYYSAQVMVLDGREKVPMDFLIRLCDAVAPAWQPPSPCGETLTVVRGKSLTMEFNVSSLDPNRIVTILALQAPPGAGTSIGPPGNPATASMWVDTSALATGTYLVVLYAQDDLGMTAPTCPVTIRVNELGCPSPMTAYSALATAGELLAFTPAFNPGESPGLWLAEMLPPAARVDPATGTLQWTPRPEDVGTVEVRLVLASPGTTVCRSEALLRIQVQGRAPDSDQDGIADDADLCASVPDQDQADADHDGIGDACDTAPTPTPPAGVAASPDSDGTPDVDGDGVLDSADNCASLPNTGQADADGDGTGDVCDLDVDGDGAANSVDDCPTLPDRLQDRDHGCQGGAAGVAVKGALLPAAPDDTGVASAPQASARPHVSGGGMGAAAVAFGAIFVCAVVGFAFWRRAHG